MYKLVIADDEQKIRTLLSEIINWNDLGFELVALCSDGDEVIEYIKKNPVDCVLCDIRMKNKTGIDVAEFIYNHYPRIKVILLSGYQDFEYSSAAFRYNVENYLLKPAKIPDLKSSFIKIKENLDMQASQLDILSNYRREVFSNLISGFFKDTKSISDAFLKLHFEFGTEDSFAIVKIAISSPIKCENYSISQFYQNMVNLDKSPIKAFFVSCDEESVTYLLFSKLCDMDTFLEFSGCICSNITDISGCECQIDKFSFYENADEFVNTLSSASSENVRFSRSVKHLHFAITSGISKDIENAATSFFECISYMSEDEYSSVLLQVIRDFKFPVQEYGELKMENLQKTLDNCKTIADINNVAKEYFQNLSKKLHSTDVQNQNILRVRNYVTEHYADDLSLEKSAAMAYLSPTYFSKVFKSITGQNYVDFVIDCKMNKAKDLLVNSTCKIHEISAAVGYHSTASFVKLFKATFGLTPTEYRNKFTKGV